MTSGRSLDDAGAETDAETDAAVIDAEAAAAAETVAAVEGVGRTFGDLTVLSDVSFSVPAGTVTAIVGPNGSGKSTLLRIVAGLLSPTTGRVELETPSERPVGYLPQTPTFRAGFSVAETLSFYADLVDVDVDVEPLLDRVGLRGVGDRRVTALSGGMVRLLGLAQATVGDPALLVLDEPSSGLDPQVSEHIFDVISSLADSGTAVVLATHDLALVERAADAVVLLDRRGIVEMGSVAEVTDAAGVETLAEAFSALVERDAEIAVRSGREGPADGGGPADGERSVDSEGPADGERSVDSEGPADGERSADGGGPSDGDDSGDGVVSGDGEAGS